MRVGATVGLFVVAIVALVPLPAGAQQGPDPGSGDPTVAAAQARADSAANAYLDALIRSQGLDAEVAELEQGIARLELRVTELRDQARGRAVEAYKRSGTQAGAQFAEEATAMDSARRTVMLDRLNAHDEAAASKLRDVRDALRTHHQELKTAQQAQADILARLKEDEERLNTQLASAQDARRGAPAASGGVAPVPVDYVARPGEHPQHNHPFLVCTRGIESGGNYRAYNPSGPYLGAYQFLQSTWNSTANHAGRGELVGVDPRDASEYDQDDMAWTLYQWKGKAPWNGRC